LGGRAGRGGTREGMAVVVWPAALNLGPCSRSCLKERRLPGTRERRGKGKNIIIRSRGGGKIGGRGGSESSHFGGGTVLVKGSCLETHERRDFQRRKTKCFLKDKKGVGCGRSRLD